ncbi:MAG: iron ABC transporter permease, partial [Mycobacterium sp.]
MVTTDPSLEAPPTPAPGSSRPGPVVSAAVALLVAATFIPIGYVLWSTAGLGPDRVYALLARPRVGELLVNTVGLVVVTVPLCLALGIGAAWLVERTDLPGR